MKKIKNIVFVLSIILITSCQNKVNTNTESSSKQQENEIESYLKEQKKVHKIPGLAVAVIKNSEVIYKGYFGIENLETNTPVNNLTMFPVYSVSKLISATAVFQLIEQGEISLEDTISKYIENLPEKWQNVSIANLLTHSSGLPDFSLFEGDISDEEMFSKISKDSIHFEKGNQWEYNQTNYWFLSKIIEKVKVTSFNDFVLNNQFSQSKSNVLFSSNFTTKIPNRVYRYDFNDELGELKKRDIIGGKRGHACNGLNISLDELILWNKNLDANVFLKPETKEKMWQPYKFINDKRTFLYGWDSYRTNNIDSYGFTGGMQTGFRKFLNQDLTIIYLSNGHKYYPIHNTVIEHIAGIVEPKLINKPALSDEKIITEFLKMNFDKAKSNYFKVRDENPKLDYEATLNNLAYAFLQKKNIDYAIKIFKLNIQEHPNSANAFDSLAESYFLNNQYELSKTNYLKSLELDPENTNAKEMINRIGKSI
ncbi:serine hydrolase [Thalassobellus citreus]|uniref:serine hydrolase n=1 Tax=Thalassobellus citreus TaxID=3367752 RepID=UPI0037955579